jgi:oxygen-dependent protoporphyrinogen oxidase
MYVLASAQGRGAPVDALLLEAADRLGGLIRTERVGEFLFEAGPDSFLTEKPEAAVLARELGLGASLIGSNDAARQTYILHRNRLRPLPQDWSLFVPSGVWSAILSGLLPVSGLLAIASEPFRFRRAVGNRSADLSVAQFVRRHFGNALLENAAEPLVAGIYGGDAERLSAGSALPRLVALERTYGSLMRGIAQVNVSRTSDEPVFTTVRDGIEQLVQALTGRLKHAPQARMHLGVRATGIERTARLAGEPGANGQSCKYRIWTHNGASFEADAVILALPAFECANVLQTFDAKLAAELQAIPYTPAVIVNLGYPVWPGNLPQGFGFLVPRRAGRRLLACTFVHAKFPFRAPKGGALLRCFLGGARDPGAVETEDEELTSLVLKELREIAGIRAAPSLTRVDRWPRAMPQYVVGHHETLSRIWKSLGSHPGLFLAGNAYSGVGISDSIRTAKAAAEQALQRSIHNSKPEISDSGMES